MITLYSFQTPNGEKIPILLEELGLPYKIVSVHIGKGEQFAPDFLALSPNNRIPAIVDEDNKGNRVTIFESGAILTYLAEKHGRFLAASGSQRYDTLQWLFWQVGGLGPMLGQIGYFAIIAKETSQLAIDRFTTEGNRLLDVMDRRLQNSAYIAGDDYTIADMASYPWVVATTRFLAPFLGEAAAQRHGVLRWMDTIGGRPAVQRAMAVPLR